MRFSHALFALIAPLVVLGDLRHSGRRSHHDIANRADASVQLHKRGSSRWTFYDVGGAPGACGAYNSPDEHIVALNSAQYGGGYPGPMCGKTIVMKYNGKQTTAKITDECPGCPPGGLDLTRGLFGFFGPLSLGVIQGEWYFADDAPADPKPSPKPSPKPEPEPEPKPKPEPKTTHKPPPPPPSTTHHEATTSTTHTTPKTTSSTEHSSTHSSTHSSSLSSSSSSASSLKVSSVVSSLVALPTGVVSAGDGPGHNIAGCNQALLNMGNLIIAGTQA